MEKTIFHFILRYSLRQQIYIVLLTIAGYPILYYTLELPKLIVNEAIGRDDFAWEDKQFLGIAFDQVTFLMALSGLFLVLIVIYGGMKYYVNVYSGRLGEQMLRRLRYQLYTRMLRFPLPHFKRVSQGEIIPMITAEVEPLGGFIGIAFATPALMGGMLCVYMFFIFQQSFFLGLAAIALYPFQAYVIPKLQRRVVMLGRDRVREVRRLGDKLGESVSGVAEIHAHDTSGYERADITRRLDRIYDIRYEIFRRKYAIKFLNNFLAQLTPFFFYSIGGYFVIRGEITFGALFGVVAAYKDLASPWKELLNYYQLQSDVRIKYDQVIDQFHPPNMMEAELQEAEPDGPTKLEGDIALSNVTFSEDGRVTAVEGVNFTVPLDRRVAIVGSGASGKDELGMLIARLLVPTAGTIRIAGMDTANMPEAISGRRMAFMSSQPYLFATSVRDNLYYGLKHRPIHIDDDPEHQKWLADYKAEAHQAGNSEDDPHADWNDYEAAGLPDRDALDKRALEVLEMVEMSDDIYRFGLRGSLDPREDPDLAKRILEARSTFKKVLEERGMSQLVEPFDEAKYNDNATMGENLLFGTPRDGAFDLARLAEHPYVQEVLEKAELTEELIKIGRQVAETMIELFSDLPPGHEFFAQYSFIESEDLPDYQALVSRTAKHSLEEMRDDDRMRLLSLPFKLIPARHRLDLISDEFKDCILKARHIFRENLPEELADSVEFFDKDEYNAAASLQDNILFGKIAYGHAQAESRLSTAIGELLDEMDLRTAVMAAGLDYHVGVGGARLSGAQRQKIGLARCILKEPDLLVLNEAITALDSGAQSRVREKVLEAFKGRGVVWVLHRASFAASFDHVIVMRSGRVAEQGAPDELDKEGTAYRELLDSE